MTDEQKAERKRVIANNKEWDAAEVVRREWLTTFLSRKTAPKNATSVIAAALSIGRSLVADSMGHGSTLASRLLGIADGPGETIERYLAAHPGRSAHVGLAITLGGIEQTTSRNSWRTPRADVGWYLHVLEEWGYPLTPVETIAAERHIADSATAHS
jgi:ParB family transcriptional regulator, chromosome partitioning protein